MLIKVFSVLSILSRLPPWVPDALEEEGGGGAIGGSNRLGGGGSNWLS